MKKNVYEKPVANIEEMNFEDVLTTSGSIDESSPLDCWKGDRAMWGQWKEGNS